MPAWPFSTCLYVNLAAESFLGRAAGQLNGLPLVQALPESGRWLGAVECARDSGMKTVERGISVRFPGDSAARTIDLSAAPVGEAGEHIVVSLHETTVSRQVDRRMGFLDAARSVTGMAAVLAHEIKNPLSGIRGASQLLEDVLDEDGRSLTELIRAEVDRVCDLIDRMTFQPQDRGPDEVMANIHEVLDRVKNVAQAGFGSHIRFTTDYDPSLPPVRADRDLLVQVFLNLVRNAVEACPAKDGKVYLATAYRSGIGLIPPGGGPRRRLGVEVTVSDNGPGIDPGIRNRLFEPFVTSKKHGSGLGLALVARVVSDLGGLIDCENTTTGPADTGVSGTVFHVLLPIGESAGTPA